MSTIRTQFAPVAAGFVVLCIVLSGAAVLTGQLPWRSSDSTRPACQLLKPKAEVQAALAAHAAQADRIRDVGSGLTVVVTDACGSLRRGIITITYGSDSEKAAVERLLNAEGLGADVELVRP